MKYLLFLTCFAFAISKGFSWNDQAHMTIAAIAWDRLDDAEKSKITSILKQHPAYKKKWKAAFGPHKKLLPLGKYLMMRASRWPDEIKKKGNLNFTYNRKEWHYIVQKLYFDREIDEKNPDIKHGSEENNVVWAIDHVINSMKNPAISNQLKAVYFSWLIHLTADIHQPLHTCSLFDGKDLKKGDRGGNDLYIRTSTDTTNLQHFWDEQLGKKPKVKLALQQGFILRREFPFNEDYLANTPKEWAQESFLIAKYKIYLNGDLKYAFKGRGEIPKVSESYVLESKKIANKQVVRAGYRLGDQLSGLL